MCKTSTLKTTQQYWEKFKNQGYGKIYHVYDLKISIIFQLFSHQSADIEVLAEIFEGILKTAPKFHVEMQMAKAILKERAYNWRTGAPRYEDVL